MSPWATVVPKEVVAAGTGEAERVRAGRYPPVHTWVEAAEEGWRVQQAGDGPLPAMHSAGEEYSRSQQPQGSGVAQQQEQYPHCWETAQRIPLPPELLRTEVSGVQQERPEQLPSSRQEQYHSRSRYNSQGQIRNLN